MFEIIIAISLILGVIIICDNSDFDNWDEDED